MPLKGTLRRIPDVSAVAAPEVVDVRFLTAALEPAALIGRTVRAARDWSRAFGTLRAYARKSSAVNARLWLGRPAAGTDNGQRLSMPLPIFPPPRSASRTFDVVGLGESSLDFVAVVSGPVAPDSKLPLDRFEAMPGGQTATALVACARLGHRARYVGALGQDDAGAAIERALTKESVDIAAVWRDGRAEPRGRRARRSGLRPSDGARAP